MSGYYQIVNAKQQHTLMIDSGTQRPDNVYNGCNNQRLSEK